MLNQEMLQELTESYLKSLLADVSAASSADFDASAPFAELGIDSFRVLKMIKALEADFGTLPKTLLFEYFSVGALAGYFVERHPAVLNARFGQAHRRSDQSGPVAAVAAAPASPPLATPARPVAAAAVPLRLLEEDLPRYPALQAQVNALFERHKNEGCVSRGTRNIAPNLFVGSTRNGYFNYCRSNDLILVYAYTGPADYFAELAAEMHRYCSGHGFQLNLFLDEVPGLIDGVPFSATPFGALQRVLDIGAFSLDGGPMRRLRYQVAKFEKAGTCRTQEYHCGSDAKVDHAIAEVIDRWCAGKTMVNPLIHLVRQEILAGALHVQHRIFLTYLDDVLQNVILVSQMCASLNGYLMDLEFYGQDMPLGGLEFAIVNIIKALAAEGCAMLSLGGTYGCRLASSPHADPGIDRLLDDLHRQQIFNDEGNLQFKNKFRPENRIIYLCRPVGSGKADNVVDIIMSIADPAKAQTPDTANHNAAEVLGRADVVAPGAVAAAAAPVVGTPRGRALAKVGFDPFDLPAGEVEHDLKTDSWAQLAAAPFVAAQMAHLRTQLQQGVDVEQCLAAVFPFRHFVLTDAGRSAEQLFCQAWPRKGVVLQNLLFPTGLYHQIDQGYTPHELPHPALLRADAQEPCRAGLDEAALRDYLAGHAAQVAFVCIELSDNAAGGLPVPVAHLQAVKALLAPHGIALVLDATRVLENAQYLVEHAPEYAGRTLWQAATDLLGCADVVIASLAKDFCIDKGGLIATNDEALLRRLQALQQQHGGGLNVIEKKLVALALQQRRQIETRVVRRMRAVESLWRALSEAGVPVVSPAGGHCVVIDAKRLPPFRDLEQPAASFVAWLYLNTGIRAGLHSVGMQKQSPLDGQVRLAVPMGLKEDEIDAIARRLVAALRMPRDIPELRLAGVPGQTRYALLRYHAATAVDASTAGDCNVPHAATGQLPAPQPAAQPVPVTAPAGARGDIAIVGMAGRYPKAADMASFWENLKAGRDCVGELPPARLAARVDTGFSRSYRGGFLDDVDRFDSLFFNISPREAEVLDPQERLFLEVAWEALEDAGYYPESLAGEGAPRNVGVFVGAVWAMYQIAGVEAKLTGREANPNSFLWSIANRVSYWMNLTGPSMTVDTACSSSLTALYLACEAIHNGDACSALVGGVNLDLHQHKFDINHAGGALSDDGVCRSFGAGANGYVAGEGVGALFIKPLAQALQDKDQIYGVIKSAVVNHGGRASGYTVPNPKAQGELIAAALARAGVDARTIGYIEAHGTGTELGDPIEIAGLTQAFERDAVAPQSCPVGSVKTNIGHLEAAAGVVGVSKVLLQMKHHTLVPSLHSAQRNAHIDFAASPFQVQQQLAPWHGKDIDGVRHPLRAGISSFGAGGANAHVVIEQHAAVPDPAAAALAPAGALVFPLSARSDGQLRAMAGRLRAHLAADAGQRLVDVAFTLQHGRKSFDHRLALVCASRAALIAGLDAFLAGREEADVLVGHAKEADGLARLLNRQEKAQFVELLCASRDPHKLARLWIDGLLPDCSGFCEQGRRVSLPTYPFADKRHWIGASGGAIALTPATARLHPLIDSNESTFQRQLFRKAFSRQEFFLRDHVVSGIPTLPGTAYLDLARKAGELATGRTVRTLRNITWVSPLAVADAPVHVQIELTPLADAVAFEVSGEEAGARRVYAQGKLLYEDGQAAPAAPEYVDLAAIRARAAKTLSGKDAYPLFEAVGLSYGPSFQLLQEVCTGKDEVLGLLRLPESRAADFDEFVLHPCLFDAAMQAGVAGQLGDTDGQMKVPYSIGEVELLHPLTRTCYSYVTKAPGGQGGVSREQVTLVDETGKVLARIRDSVGVPLSNVHDKRPPVVPAAPEDAFAELYYGHAWHALPLAAQPDEARPLLIFGSDPALQQACARRGIASVLVLPGEGFAQLDQDCYRIDPGQRQDYALLFDALAQRGFAVEQVCYGWPEPGTPDDAATLSHMLERGVYAFFFFCQALIVHKPAGRTRLLYLYRATPEAPQPQHEAINGFARSLRLENPRIDCKALALPPTLAPDEALALALAELHPDAQHESTVRYDAGVRYVRVLERLPVEAARQSARPGVALRQRGVYLITGGAGGLGLIFAEFLAGQCDARLVLTGRSALSAEQQRRLQALEAGGAQVLYLRADIARAEDVQRVLGEAKARFGRLDGIVHAAGVLRDAFLRNKTREDMAAVFAPKLFGAFHLDRQTRADDLDFFVTFSSLAAIGGNTGQCDYAFANHYLDSFAVARQRLVAAGRRSGHTLSLNWSLWAEGGMQLDEQTELFFRNRLGIRPLSTAFGLAAFARWLASPLPQVAVLEGVQAKIEQAWGIARDTAPVASPSPAPAAGDGDLSAAVTAALSQIVMTLLKLDAADLALDSILLDLGFDSIGLTTFANAINDRYQLEVNPILFFEYPSIRAVAGVLATQHADAVRRVHEVAAAAPAIAPVPVAAPGAMPGAIDKRRAVVAPQPAPGGDFSRERRFADMPIAIVGIAGRMPQSDDLETFWDHLSHARNLVTEIPRDRWRWEDYDGNPIKEVNKSNSRWGGFMTGIDRFDPLFFGITPREAEMMDPQQRLFIETVWHAIEDAGHRVSDLSGTRTGVFVGVSAKDYVDVLAENESTLDGFSASGNSHSILANRISFLLNLRGPSAPLDTACSSSLIALHRAIESIHTGSCDMAIVGGVQVMLTPVGHISLSSAGMLSTDGRCKTFDKDANGYVRGEGSGAILIKPLDRAQQDGNPIYAVVRATAENHGGRVTMLTAPNPKAQAELLLEAYDKAQIDPATVGYIECHGTGTSLGDPIEIQALKKSFSDLYRKHGRAAPTVPHCGLSSVKTNIGHLEPAAGIASLLKVLLAIKHRQIPALLHFETLNPYIDLEGSPFYIAARTTAWAAPVGADGAPLPRRAGVSSFGWGGANAHVVLEEYLAPATAASPAGPQLVLLSARSGERLKDYAAALLAHLDTHDAPLADLAYTLQVGRDPMEERLALVAGSRDQLGDQLRAFVDGAALAPGVHRGRVARYRRNEQGLSTLAAGEAAGAAQLEGWLATGDLVALAQAWVDGVDPDWQRLQRTAASPRRLSLPGYPFARDRHWIATRAKAARPGTAAALHPLVHANVSTLGQQRYASVFSGREWFLTDHHGTLPAMACVEMARAATALAQPAAEGMVPELRQLVWSAPPAPVPGIPFGIDLRAGRDGAVLFEIQGGTTPYCAGSVHWLPSPAPRRLDVAQLKALMAYGALDAAQSAALLAKAAPRGPLLHTVIALYRGYRQSLAQLALPAGHAGDDGHVLHPALLDGALQSAAALAASLQPHGGTPEPATLGAARVLAPCNGPMYAWVRPAYEAASDALTLDVDLMDAQGAVCVQLKALGFAGSSAPAAASGDEFTALLDAAYQGQVAGAAPGSDEFARILEDLEATL
ncbi:SDR family NAD(P)-dependent oxidoreductase [Chitiniphilus purpureus]|uniref:SDR family NAD(P)-dependent oxidoreductase n=1 Tax=Chitiniphilus purpureus TaxID=2981137 RepID=A0ABY6DP34_9NEIS|nr:SDR family NAD(P)-dependent oxidoreductase [Chitiniphilus sp. CD1]UXY16137.1 SDR family NAD(P)-dependent oxidoreductase [Chitiniphilus sp. CD1]